MIKALFLDFDGTIYSHETDQVPPSALEALRAFKANGGLLFIATGRQVHGLLRMDAPFHLFDGYSTLNGALTLGTDLSHIEERPITGIDRENIEMLFRERRTCMQVVEEDRFFSNYVSEEALAAHRAINSLPPEPGELSEKPIYQVEFYLEPGKEEEAMKLLPGCSISRWSRYMVDCTSANAGKDKGVRALMEKHSLKDDEIIVFGDADNDVPMFRAFPHSVALGNASPDAKEAAAFVTSHIDEDGILNGMRRFGAI